MKPGSDNQIRSTAALWANESNVYLEGTRMYETDTGWFKVSDGTQTFAAMGAGAYFKPGNGDGGASIFTPSGLFLFFNDQATVGDPTAGCFKFNSATVGSITKLYVSTIDQNGESTVAWLNLCTSGTLKVHKPEGGHMLFNVLRMVEESTYFEFDVAHTFGALPLVGNCYVDFVPDAPGVRSASLRIYAEGLIDPPVTYVQDSLGITGVSRTAVGIYLVNSNAKFTDFKTVVEITGVVLNDANPVVPVFATYTLAGTSQVEVGLTDAAGTPLDGLLTPTNFSITIKVYN